MTLMTILVIDDDGHRFDQAHLGELSEYSPFKTHLTTGEISTHSLSFGGLWATLLFSVHLHPLLNFRHLSFLATRPPRDDQSDHPARVTRSRCPNLLRRHVAIVTVFEIHTYLVI
jgi:hypothetical protein